MVWAPQLHVKQLALGLLEGGHQYTQAAKQVLAGGINARNQVLRNHGEAPWKEPHTGVWPDTYVGPMQPWAQSPR